MRKKHKRHSGRYTPRFAGKVQMKYSEITAEALEPNVEYDDWLNYRDGMRDHAYYEWKRKDKKKRTRKKKTKSLLY